MEERSELDADRTGDDVEKPSRLGLPFKNRSELCIHREPFEDLNQWEVRDSLPVREASSPENDCVVEG